MSILHLRDLGAYGIIADVDPYNIPINAFSSGLNIRFDDGSVERAPVFRHIDYTGTLTDASTGTPIGDLTGGGGLAAAFDANNSQTVANTANLGSATTGYVGLTLAEPKAIASAVTYGASDYGYIAGVGGNITLTLYGKQGTAPASSTDGTVIGTVAQFADASSANPKTITSTDTTTEWDHVWLKVDTDGSAGTICIAELEIYVQLNEPRACVSYTGNSGAEELNIVYRNGCVTKWTLGGDEVDVSISGYTPSDSDGRITTCKLGGVQYINRNDRVPWYWTPGDSIFSALGGGWDATWRCNVLRAYNDCLVAFNVTKGSTNYPSMVKTSEIATYDAIPSTWDETDLTASATENILAEMQGDILDAQTLGNNMIIYTRLETWMMTADGSDSIYSYRRIFNDAGIINANCAVEIEGKHYVFGYKDIWVHDGVGKESISNSRVRKEVFTNLSFALDYRCFVHASTLLNEIYFCYHDGTVPDDEFAGVDGCNRAAVYNYKNNTWTFYSLPNVFYAADMVLSNPATYESATTTYAGMSASYFNVSETGKRAPVFIGDTNAGFSLDAKIYAIDMDGPDSVVAYETDANATLNWHLSKEGADLDELNEDLRGYKNIIAIYPQARLADDEQTIEFAFSSADTFGAVESYGDYQSYDNLTYYKLDYKDGGRYLSYTARGTNGGLKYFNLTGIDFDVEITGER